MNKFYAFTVTLFLVLSLHSQLQCDGSVVFKKEQPEVKKIELLGKISRLEHELAMTHDDGNDVSATIKANVVTRLLIAYEELDSLCDASIKAQEENICMKQNKVVMSTGTVAMITTLACVLLVERIHQQESIKPQMLTRSGTIGLTVGFMAGRMINGVSGIEDARTQKNRNVQQLQAFRAERKKLLDGIDLHQD